MCPIFCLCSKRFSVIMMSTTFCNLLLASFGAPSSTVNVHPLGVLSKGKSTSFHFVCEHTIKPRNRPIVHQGPSHLCLSRVNRHEFLLHPCTQANVDPHPIQQTCALSSTVLQLPRPSLICLHLSSDLTPTTRPTGSML